MYLGAYRFDRTLAALWSTCSTDPSSMDLNEVAERHPVLLRDNLAEILFDMVWITSLSQPHPLRQSHHMGIYPNGWPPKGISNNDVRRFSPYARQPNQILGSIRHLALKSYKDFLAASPDGLCLVAIKAGGPYLLL